jgi:hypothetical protein
MSLALRQNQEVVSMGRAVAGLLVSVAAITLAASMLLLVFENRGLRESQECRYDISAEVNAIGDRVDQATARGLVALAEEDDAGLAEQIAVIQRETALLGPALEKRNRAVEVCK